MKFPDKDAALVGGAGGGRKARAVYCSIHSRLIMQGQRELMYQEVSPQSLYD